MAIPSHKRNQLADFHHTISEQLNSRLAESPRFFWGLIVVSTGYGYVLWGVANNPVSTKPELRTVLIIASLLSYVAVLWASCYLAALGYAFRYLQNVQHCIEHALGWNIYGPDRGQMSPGEPCRCSDIFWLLPGIYHAHAYGLLVLLAIIILAFCSHSIQWWGSCSALLIGFISLVIGVGFIICVNVHYVRKYRKKRKDPAAVLDD